MPKSVELAKCGKLLPVAPAASIFPSTMFCGLARAASPDLHLPLLLRLHCISRLAAGSGARFGEDPAAAARKQQDGRAVQARSFL